MSETQTTLRDTLAAELEKVESQNVQNVGTNGENEAKATTPSVVETAEQKEERLRDEKGRFAPGKPEAKPQVAQKTEVTPVQRPQRPSSWKKDYWEHWDKLDPKLAEYINQREQEYAKGVSTYKQEWEQAKPLIDAIAPFQQKFQQYGANVTGQDIIRNLGTAHFMLAEGSPQQKLQLIAKMIQDYQVPIEHMFVQGQDGKIYFNQQILQAPQVEQTPDIDQVVEQKLLQRDVQNELKSFESNTEQYPHFQQVRNTMAGLLQSGLAEDLKSAYEAAIRIPQHADIWETIQQQKRDQEEAQRAEEARRKVHTAKANAISPKTSTPSSPGQSKGKGLRSTLEEKFDEFAGGRV